MLQVGYNLAEILSLLNPSAEHLFLRLLSIANPVIYGVCLLFVIRYVIAASGPWLRLQRGEPVADSEMETARKNLLLIPRRLAVIGAAGWLTGAIVFPGIIYGRAGAFGLDVWMHFVCSFVISCTIAVTFSYSLLLAVVVYGFYPTSFASPYRFARKSTRELAPIRTRWHRLSIIAGLIPLAAVILLVTNFRHDVALQASSGQVLAFKFLVVGLILSSTAGFGFVRYVGQAVTRLIDVCAK